MLRVAEMARGQVSTVGLAAPKNDAEAIVKQLAHWGVTRVCPIGQMQDPPLGGATMVVHPWETSSLGQIGNSKIKIELQKTFHFEAAHRCRAFPRIINAIDFTDTASNPHSTSAARPLSPE